MPLCPPWFVLNSQAPGEGPAVTAVFLLGSSDHRGAAEPLAGEMGSLPLPSLLVLPLSCQVHSTRASIRLRCSQDVGTLQESSMPQNTHFKQFLLPWLLKFYQASAEGLQFNIFIYCKYSIWVQKQARIALVLGKYFKYKFSVRKINPAKDVRGQDEKYSAFNIYHHMRPEEVEINGSTGDMKSSQSFKHSGRCVSLNYRWKLSFLFLLDHWSRALIKISSDTFSFW